METLRTILAGLGIAIGAAILFSWIYNRAQARDRLANETAAAGDLHGVATVSLPRRYRSRGLSGSDRSLTPEEQLARHDETQPLTFMLERDPSNDWGGHARDPELLNIVFLPPSERTDIDEALAQFSIGRYYSPMGHTIPLDSPRWEQGSDGRYRWRVLAMNDHFGTDHKLRWAIAMLDPSRGVRLDLFIWQKRAKRDKALAMVRGILDSLEIKPALDAHFSQEGGVQARLTRLRDANIEQVFAALEAFGVRPPAPGETTFGRAVGVWLDEDRRAIHLMRMLASVPLQHGAERANRDHRDRPLLPLVLKPEQYPGPTQDGLPSLGLQMLYWNPALERWQRSGLQRATTNEAHPLLPFEDAVVARLEQMPGARDAAHIIRTAHWFHPPALDDARRVGPFLEECDFWQRELLAGKIVGGEVREPMLNASTAQ